MKPAHCAVLLSVIAALLLLVAGPGTHRMDVAPADAFNRAQHAARDMGWEIVAADAAAGRIEATGTTFRFGFKDDVVIRVAAGPELSSRLTRCPLAGGRRRAGG